MRVQQRAASAPDAAAKYAAKQRKKLGGAYATPKKYRQPDHAIEPSEPTPPWQFAALGNVPRITVTVHLISILEIVRAHGVAALSGAL